MTERTSDSTGRSRPVDSFLARLRGLVYWIAVSIFVATVTSLFAAIFVNVVLRYIFEQGIAWAYEIPAILFPWSVASAVVVATVFGRNIQVALLTNLLSATPRRIIGMIVQLAMILVSIGVIWTSGPILNSSQYTRLAETGITQIYGVSSLIYCFAMIAIIATIDLVHLVRGAGYLEVDDAEAKFG